MKKRLKPITAAVTAALTLSLTVCPAVSNTVKAAETRTDLNLRIGDAFNTLDPHNLALNADIAMSRQIYEPLYWINDAGEEIPLLATEYSVSEDGLTWTFKLREGVTFQNGDPLKASDVKYSYERCFNNAYMQEKTEAIDSVEAPDDTTVVFHLKNAFAPLLEKIASIGIVSESFTEENKDEEGYLGTNACGTGAYTVSEVIPDVSVTMEAYPGYWGGEAPIKTLNYELITDDSTAISAFEAGEVDVMLIPTSYCEEISSSEEYNTATLASNHCTYLVMNTAVAPFDSKEVRQAVAYAVNRQDIIDIAADGYAAPATTIATPYMFGYTEDHAVYDYDPEKAKELLAQAGYTDGLDIGSIKTLGGTYFEKIVQVVQAELADVGITSTIESMDGNSLVNDCITGNFGLADMGQSMSLDYDFMKTYYCEEYIDGLNMARFSDPEIEALFDEAATTTDKEARLAAYQKIEDLTQEACVYVPLYNMQSLYAWSKDLNYTPSVNGVLYKDFSWN